MQTSPKFSIRSFQISTGDHRSIYGPNENKKEAWGRLSRSTSAPKRSLRPGCICLWQGWSGCCTFQSVRRRQCFDACSTRWISAASFGNADDSTNSTVHSSHASGWSVGRTNHSRTSSRWSAQRYCRSSWIWTRVSLALLMMMKLFEGFNVCSFVLFCCPRSFLILFVLFMNHTYTAPLLPWNLRPMSRRLPQLQRPQPSLKVIVTITLVVRHQRNLLLPTMVLCLALADHQQPARQPIFRVATMRSSIRLAKHRQCIPNTERRICSLE